MAKEVEIPHLLVEKIAERKCIAFVGSGPSQGAGAPSWDELIKALVDHAQHYGREKITKNQARALKSTINSRKKSLEMVAEAVMPKIGEERFRTFMQKTFGNLKPKPLHEALIRVPFRAIFTTNYDTLIEDSYRNLYGSRPTVITEDAIEDAERADGNDEFYIFKFHGCVSNPQTMVLAQPDYLDLEGRDSYQDFMISQLKHYCFFFIGYSFSDRDTNRFFDRLNRDALKDRKAHTAKHFSLMTKDELRDGVLVPWSSRNRLQFISLEDYDEIPKILRQLSDRVKEESKPDELAELINACGWRIDDILDETAIRIFLCVGEIESKMHTIALVTFKGKQNLTIMKEACNVAKKRSRDKTIVVVDNTDVRNKLTKSIPGNSVQIWLTDDLVSQVTRKIRECYTEFIDDRNLTEIEDKYISPAYRFIQEKTDVKSDLDEYTLKWLSDRNSGELCILGDFGIGKTWFAQHFINILFKELSTDPENIPIPIFVPLRQTNATDILSAVEDILMKHQVYLAGGRTSLKWLINEGKLLLVLDGADEWSHNFFLDPLRKEQRYKIIVTCRTHYFRTFQEYRSILGLEGQKTVDVIELLGFDDTTIVEAIKKSNQDKWKKIYKDLESRPDLWDMAHRPLFLNMVIETLASQPDGDIPTIADIYKSYVTRSLCTRWEDRENKEEIVEALLEALEELAWMGQSCTPRIIAFSLDQIREAASKAAKAIDFSEDEESLYKALYAESILVRNPEDEFEFGHLSLQEYLTAAHLCKQGKSGIEKIAQNIDEDDWREVLWLYSSVSGDASVVLDACLKYEGQRMPECLFLAARSLEAARQFSHPRAGELGKCLIDLFRGDMETNAYSFLENIYAAIRRMGEAGKEALRRCLKSESSNQVRRRCLLTWYESFGHDAFAEALPYLDLTKARDEHVRWHAAEVVAEVAEKDNLEKLQIYANDEETIIRGNVLWALKRLDFTPPHCSELYEKLVKDLYETVMNEDDDFHRRSHSALLLGRCLKFLDLPVKQIEEMGTSLAKLLEDSKSKWRGYVARALNELGWNGAVSSLCQYLCHGDDEAWHRYAVDAVANLARVDDLEDVKVAQKALAARYPHLSRRLTHIVLALENERKKEK